MVHDKNRIPYWIDRRLTGLAGPAYDATISFGLPFEPEDSQYGEYRITMLKLYLIASLLVLFSCGEGDNGPITKPTPTPTSTPFIYYTPTAVQTASSIRPTVNPTTRPTTQAASKGLGVSRNVIQSMLEKLGYRFGTEKNNRVIGVNDSTDIVLVNPKHNLSKVHMIFSAYSSEATVLDMTALAIAINPSLGDLEWMFDGFIAGNKTVSKVSGRVKVTGEVLGSSSVAITFEPQR